MSKEEIEKQLKLSKRQSKDERYDYLCSEFNAINYCINLEKYTNKLQQENQDLKENAENNDKVVDKVNWENMLLKKENQELKKQLEEYQEELEKADSITQSCIFNGKKESEISYRKCLNMLEKHNNQQKEFINFLEDNYKETQDIWYIKILQKYKSIIGDDK